MSHPRTIVTLLALTVFLASVEGTTLLGGPSCPDPHGVHAYPHPESCNSYFLCTNGSLTLEYCENGLLFDGHGAVYEHCNYYWAVNCGDRKADLTPDSTASCEHRFGMYPISDECSTTYIKCIHGHPYETPCEAGLVYEEKSHNCVWPDQLPNCNPEEIVGFKCPHKVPSHSAAAKFWPYPRFPVPGDCGRLITCVDGNPRLLTCGEGKLFDSTTLSCMDPDELPHCANNL